MDVILIPGLWQDGSAWDRVVPVLTEAGHVTRALTLPGMESVAADRTRIGLRDHVDAVVACIDATATTSEPVALVAHSAGAGVAHAALDARPERVGRVIYVGGFPTPDGEAIAADFAVEGGSVPLPDWSAFETEDLQGLDDAALAGFRARAIPSPAGVARDRQELSDERRYDVPVTVVSTEFSSATLRDWIAQDLAPVREFARIRDVTFVDLPTGHWPQFSRPVDLGRIIVTALAGPVATAAAGAGEP